jgi:hypothetical protein
MDVAPPDGRVVAPRMPAGVVVRGFLLVTLTAAVLGIPYGLLWSAMAPKIPVVKVEGGLLPADPAPEQFVAGDGWFLLLGVGFGLVAGFAAWFLGRRVRGPVAVLLLAIGGTVGGALAWWIGHRIGLGAYEHALAAAPEGTPLDHPAALRVRELQWWHGFLPNIRGVLLVEPFIAVLAYTLLAGWSRFASLRPEPATAAAPPSTGSYPPPPPWAEQYPGEHGRQLSSDYWARPDPSAAPERPATDEAGSPRG